MILIPRVAPVLAMAAIYVFSGYSQAANITLPGDPQPIIALAECVQAAILTSPLIKLADFNLSTANAAWLQARAKNGLLMGESIDYSHQGTFLDTNNGNTNGDAAQAAAGNTLNGENFQGILSLTGPSTSLSLTARHSIGEGTSVSQVSALNLSGSQTLFDGYPAGRASATVQVAQFSFQAAQISYTAARNAAFYTVKQAYYILLGDQDTVVLRQAIVGQAAENQALYNGLFTAQRATKLDVLQVQIELSQANLNLKTAQNLALTDRKKLSLAIGWPLEKDYSVADSPLSDLPLSTVAAALQTALQNRPEMLILERSLDAAVIALSLQNSLGTPVLTLIASVGIGPGFSVGPRCRLVPIAADPGDGPDCHPENPAGPAKPNYHGRCPKCRFSDDRHPGPPSPGSTEPATSPRPIYPGTGQIPGGDRHYAGCIDRFLRTGHRAGWPGASQKQLPPGGFKS